MPATDVERGVGELAYQRAAVALAGKVLGAGHEVFEPSFGRSRHAGNLRLMVESRLGDEIGDTSDVPVAAVAQIALEDKQHFSWRGRIALRNDAQGEIGRKLVGPANHRGAFLDEVGS